MVTQRRNNQIFGRTFLINYLKPNEIRIVSLSDLWSGVMHGLDRLIIENRMRIEAADIFVIALNIIVAMGQKGLNYWRPWGLQVYFELLDDWMILLINGYFFYRLVHVMMVPSLQRKKETNVWEVAVKSC